MHRLHGSAIPPRLPWSRPLRSFRPGVANALDMHFYLRLVAFAALPLLTLLATHFPSVGHYVISLLQAKPRGRQRTTCAPTPAGQDDPRDLSGLVRRPAGSEDPAYDNRHPQHAGYVTEGHERRLRIAREVFPYQR